MEIYVAPATRTPQLPGFEFPLAISPSYFLQGSISRDSALEEIVQGIFQEENDPDESVRLNPADERALYAGAELLQAGEEVRGLMGS